MILDKYTIVYLLSNIFGTYLIFKFMHVFFESNKTSRKIEFISYIIYFIIIGGIYLKFDSPIINLVVNLSMFFLLTLNYASTWKSRLTAAVFVYAILLSVEAIIVLGLHFLNINKYFRDTDIELILALISTKILSYVVILALSNFKMVKNRMTIYPLHWLAIFVIPIGTLFSTFMLITSKSIYDLSLIIVGILILFVVNIFVFYLYDVLIKSYQEKLEKRLLLQQNNAYIKQFQVINWSQENIKMLRHDLKQHMLAVQTLIEKNDKSAALEYLQSIFELFNSPDEYAKSGNVEVDSILNNKIHDAVKQNIEVDLKITIPEKLMIHPFDLSVILGNLLDNAIEATLKVNGEKKINISIELERNVIYIHIVNPFEGKLAYEGNKLITTNKDKENHGLGLRSVQQSVDKYNGEIDIYQTNKKFHVDVLIFNTNINK